MERGLSLYEEHSPPSKGLKFSANWWKFYTVYKYDFELYHEIKTDIANKPSLLLIALYLPTIPACVYLFYFLTIKMLRKSDEAKVRNMCFVLDEHGQKQHLGDAKHIYRISVLKNLRANLADRCFDVLFQPQTEETTIVRDFGDYTYYEERYTTETYIYGATRYKGQAFITKDIQLNWVADEDIRTQVKAYINVLRLCKKGVSLDEAVKQVKRKEIK